ncbi:MAG: GDP-mannose 4,6-dehydratase, partial [Chloroflexi bacterium]|nr:GDP-mannose 4,6-dehydratase [Chloroflexota bacterium]
MRILVTGAAGFIGRWLVGELLARGHEVLPIDNLAAGRLANLAEFEHHPRMLPFEEGDVRDAAACRRWVGRVDAVAHLAASISVQDSIDRPQVTFDNDVVGTFRLLEAAREAAADGRGARFLFMSSCMVYAPASDDRGIDENHPTRPASVYAASKLAGEALTLGYGRAYGLPVTVVRPFNTYGPYQRSDGEGGVVAVFVGRALAGRTLQVFGDGSQTRDLLYVEDCARFVCEALLCRAAEGRVLNAGTCRDVAIAELARMIQPDPRLIERVPHHHPQSEIPVLRCDARRAAELLGWRPQVRLEEGLARTRA